jgi:hypothetical protein
MRKIFFPLVISIFAPPLLWLTFGGQLIYASRLTRRRLIDKAHLLIRIHTTPSLRPKTFYNVAWRGQRIHRQTQIGPPIEQASSRSLLHLGRLGSERQTTNTCAYGLPSVETHGLNSTTQP